MPGGWPIQGSRWSGSAIQAFPLLADLRDERGTSEAFGTTTYPSAVHFTGAGWLTANRGTAVRLTRAILRTLDWMRTHSEEDIAARTPAALRGEDAGLYVEALKNSRHMFSTDGVMPAEGAASVRNVLAMSMEKVRRATIDLSTSVHKPVLVAER